MRHNAIIGSRRTDMVAWAIISFFTLVSPALGQPGDDSRAKYERLFAQLHELHDRGDYRQGREVAMQMAALAPRDPMALYNVACMECLCGNREAALEWLGRAVDAGLPDAALPANDADLKTLQDDPRFKALLARIKAPSAAEPPPPQQPAAPEPSSREQSQAARGAPASRQEPSTEATLRASRNWVIAAPAGLNRAAPAPLVVALHGADESGARMAERWSKTCAAAGAVLIAPNGPCHEGAGMYRWSCDPQAADARIRDAIAAVSADYAIDPQRIVLVGFCQGAALAAQSITHAPERYLGAILTAGELARLDRSLATESLKGRRIYVMVGGKDAARTVTSAQAARDALSAAGATVMLRVFDETGHAYPQPEDANRSAALAYVLGL